MIKKILITLSIVIGIIVVAFIGYLLIIIAAFGGFDKDYSVSDLKENFEKNKTEIHELKRYFNEIVPKNRFVDIEFKDDMTLGRFGISALDSTAGNPNAVKFLEWNLKTNTTKMDSLITSIGWTRETLKTLKEKLGKANCIQISSGDPSKIGFKRSGMGIYSFNIFTQPIPDHLIEQYNDSCTYIFVNKKLVLEYGGGAFGNDCFYNLN